MSIEIEAKMRLADLPAMERRLKDLGAERVVQLVETNTFFDAPGGTLKSTDQGLRVRIEKIRGGGRQRVVITHKGPRAHGKLKSRSETELQVEGPREAAAMLAALGFYPVLTFEKKRQRWQLDGCAVELDTLPHLGDFIEIEGPSDDAVLAVREKLGLATQPLIRASYIAMLATHLADQGIQTDRVTFDEPARAADSR